MSHLFWFINIIISVVFSLTRPEKEAEIVLRSHGNAGMKLADSKMVLSTAGGALILIDDLNIRTLKDDFMHYTLPLQSEEVC